MCCFPELTLVLMSLSTLSKRSKKPKRLGKVSASPSSEEMDQWKEFYLLTTRKNVENFFDRLAVLEKDQKNTLKDQRRAIYDQEKAVYELSNSCSARFPKFTDADLFSVLDKGIGDLGELALDPKVPLGVGELALGPLPALDLTPFSAPTPAPAPAPAPAVLRPKKYRVTILTHRSSTTVGSTTTTSRYATGTEPSAWFSKRSYVYQTLPKLSEPPAKGFVGPPSATCTSSSTSADPLVINID